MLTRLGNVLYWLGTIVAVLAIGGSLIWNGVAYFERQDAEERLAVLEASRPPPLAGTSTMTEITPFDDELKKRGIFPTDEIESPFAAELRRRGLLDAPAAKSPFAAEPWLKYQRAERLEIADTVQDQRNSMLFGGIAFLIGLGAYGVGWTARYILRGPS